MMYPDSHVASPLPNPNAALMPIDTLAGLLGLTLPVAEPLNGQLVFASEGVSRLIRQYTGRYLSAGSFTEEFGPPGYMTRAGESLPLGVALNLTEWPIDSITSTTANGLTINMARSTLNRSTGRLWIPWEGQTTTSAKIRVVYVGGYDPLPSDMAAVYLDLVRRQLASMGADLSAGGSTIPVATAPVKAVTVGALKVEYAVASQPAAAGAQGGASPFTTDALAGYASTLDEYRSVRKLAATVN